MGPQASCCGDKNEDKEDDNFDIADDDDDEVDMKEVVGKKEGDRTYNS